MSKLKKQIYRLTMVFTMFSLVLTSVGPSFTWSISVAQAQETVNIEAPVPEPVLEDPGLELKPKGEVINPLPVPPIIEPLPEPILDPNTDVGEEQNADQPNEEIQTTDETPIDMYADRDNAGLQPKDAAGKYNVDEFSGVFSYSYDLQIPAGRNGLQPSLSLNYNHRAQNKDSFVGYGWTLSMPSIERENRSGIDKLYDEKYFTLNLGGSERLEPISTDASGFGSYGKMVESDFAKIEYDSNNKWIVTDKLGTIYTFGVSADARQDDPSNSAHVYKWLLEEIRDTNDNFVRYEYYKADGQIYPKKIIYTGHGTEDGIFSVNFEPFASGTPTARTKTFLSYQNGFGVETKYNLDGIDVKINNELVTKYNLIVGLNTKENKYLLNEISPTFYQNSSQYVKDEVNFNYSQQGVTYAEGTGYTLPNNYHLGEHLANGVNKSDLFIDVNGDSFVDYLRINCSNNNVTLETYLNNKDNGWATSTPYSKTIGSGTCRGVGSTIYSMPISFAEINGDSMIDLISNTQVFANNGNGWDTGSSITLPVSLVQTANANSAPMNSVMFVDMNQDGYDDIVYNYHPDQITAKVDVYLRNPSSSTWSIDNDFSLQVTFSSSDCMKGGDPYGFGDVNGDGLMDVFYNYICEYASNSRNAGAAVYLNKGGSTLLQDSNYEAPYQPLYWRWDAINPSYVINYFSDFNRDAISDHGNYSKNINGSNFTGVLSLGGQEIFDRTVPSNITNPVAVVDFNGDQTTDAMYSDSTYSVYFGKTEAQDLLNKINYQSGAKVHVYYDQSTEEKNGSTLLNPNLPYNLIIAKELVVDNGMDQWTGQKYTYQDGQTASYPTQKIKDVYGFSQVEKEIGQARPDVDVGTGVDGAFVSSGNATWASDKNFTSLNIQSGHTITVEPNVVIKVQGEVVIDGTLTAYAKGYAGGGQTQWGGANGTGPGWGEAGAIQGSNVTSGGGGAGFATIGQNAETSNGYGRAGLSYGNQELDPIQKGSGGGGSADTYPAYGAHGGAGGGIIQLFANSIVVNGQINADGENGQNGQGAQNHYSGGGGAGSGGSIYLKAVEDVNLGTGLVHANGGLGGNGGYFNDGGNGSVGRIRVEAKNISGTTYPTYFSKGEFIYSVDNTPTDQSKIKIISDYALAKDDGLAMHGKLQASETQDYQDNLLLKSWSSWQTENLGSNRNFVYKTQDVGAKISASNVEYAQAKTYDYNLDNGNILTESNLGKVNININTGAITSNISGDEKDTTYQYAENITKHILAAPQEKQISNTAESKSQEMYYDNQNLGFVEKVNLTKENYVATQSVEVNRTFNNLGLVESEISPKGATTTIAYDAVNLYPDSQTNALNQTTLFDYNLLNGQPTLVTSATGAKTQNTFDAFGRLTKVEVSDPDNINNFITKQEIIYNDSVFPRYQETKDYFTATNYVTSRQYFDGLGRVVQSKKQLADGNFATVDMNYDGQGRLERQSLPYSTNSLSYSATDYSQPAKVTQYDSLDRVISEITPVGITNYEYDGMTTIITDPNGVRKDLTKDAYGNLAEVKEYNNDGANVYTTNYEYSLTNKLKKITDSAGNIRNFTYDALDNLTNQDMVHKPGTTPAAISYTHDKNGNVLTETSFKNDAISYTYDDLNRVQLEKLAGATKITYTYDQGASNIGQLTLADYGNGNKKAYNYDVLGRLLTSTTTINNINYALSYQYDLAGNVSQITYPNNYKVKYFYNTSGQVSYISLDKGQGWQTVASGITYNVNGQMTHLWRANNVTTDYTYDSSQAYRLTRILTTKDSTKLQDINYTYDNVGNILTIVDSSDGDLAKTVTYTYDDLHRLLSATAVYVSKPELNYSLSYAYDSIGNMTSNSTLGTMQYMRYQPHQLTHFGTKVLNYDNAGNVINNTINEFTYDWRNRLTYSRLLSQSTDKSYYEYDHNNQRFLKYTTRKVYHPDPCEYDTIAPGGEGMMNQEGMGLDGLEIPGNEENSVTSCGGYYTTDTIDENRYIDKYFEKDLLNNTKDHIYLGSTKLATINNTSSPYYILSDHLGSSTILVDNSGSLAEQSDYNPYGGVVYNNTLQNLDNDYNYTGKETDAENTLQYFGARYMDNNTARFYGVDPALIHIASISDYLSDPQSLNTYVYARNNPIILIDPDGNEWYNFFMNFNQNIISGAVQVGKMSYGTGKGAVSEAASIADGVLHPIQTAKNTVNLVKQGAEGGVKLAFDMADDKVGTLNEINDGINISIKEWINKDSVSQGEDVGKLAVDTYVMGKTISAKPVMSKGMPALEIGDKTVGLNNNPVLRVGKGYLEKGATEKQFRVSFGNKDSFIHGHIHANNIFNPSKWIQKLFKKEKYD